MVLNMDTIHTTQVKVFIGQNNLAGRDLFKSTMIDSLKLSNNNSFAVPTIITDGDDSNTKSIINQHSFK